MVVSSTYSTVDRPRSAPNCRGSSFAVTRSKIQLPTYDSSILDRVGVVREIGRKSDWMLVGELTLGIGITLACFQDWGKIPDKREALNSLLADVTSRNSNLNTSTKIVGRIPETKEPSRRLQQVKPQLWWNLVIINAHLLFDSVFPFSRVVCYPQIFFLVFRGKRHWRTYSPVEGSSSDGFSCDVSTPVRISWFRPFRSSILPPCCSEV